MEIRPYTAIRNNYRNVADYCIETGLPVFLTNNGEGELVVMSIQAWLEERRIIQSEMALLRVEDKEAAGVARYTPASDVFAEIGRIIDDAEAALP